MQHFFQKSELHGEIKLMFLAYFSSTEDIAEDLGVSSMFTCTHRSHLFASYLIPGEKANGSLYEDSG